MTGTSSLFVSKMKQNDMLDSTFGTKIRENLRKIGE